MNITTQQLNELLVRLKHDYEFKETHDYLQQGICPSCGKKELFVSKTEPLRICCNRLNNCGYSESTYELYKHSLFANWSEQYQPTQENPNATADAYLRNARGFEIGMLLGSYHQEYYIGSEPNQKTATVRFMLSDGKAHWERFIDNVDAFGGQPSRALGSFKGLWWQLPNTDFSKTDTVYITEGIFNAIALMHAGFVAIACISSSHYPSGFFEMLRQKKLKPQIIFALDNDNAGHKGLRKHIPQARADGFWTKGCLPPVGKDWNDLWIDGNLNDDAIKDGCYRSDLLLAKTASKAARVEYMKTQMNTFPLTHNSKTYWFELDTGAYSQAIEKMQDAGKWNDQDPSCIDEALQESASVKEIANCKVSPLYFQRDLDTDDSRYFVRIEKPNTPNLLNTFTGRQLSSAADFKTRLLSICPGALYEGNGKQLDRIIKNEFNRLYTVDKIDYTGYVSSLDAWIYRDFGVHNGRIIKANEEEFIAMDNKHSIKTVADIDIVLNQEKPNFSWLNDYIGAFDERGLIALTHFTGTLFAEQIRQQQQSYPFLEVTGDAGTGKTTMIEFIWRLLGRSGYEGFDAAKATKRGLGREFGKVSGFPVVLIEGDRNTGNKGLDFEQLKDLYNGRTFFTRAKFNNGLDTYAPPFRGSVVIVQNAKVVASEAVLSRIIPLSFEKAKVSLSSKECVDRLNSLKADDIANYLTFILTNAKSILQNYFEVWQHYEKRVAANEQIREFRLVHNAAQMMAMLSVISKLIGISEDWLNKTLNVIEKISEERQHRLTSDDPQVSEFWDTVEYISSRNDGWTLNHAKDEALMAISLPQIESVFKNNGINILPRVELCQMLEKGKRYEYIGRKAVYSVVLKKTVKCMVFRINNGAKND